MGFPVIGNMLMMDKLTHRGLAKLANKYGGILHLKMGSGTLSSFQARKQADMAFSDYGPFWRQMRKLCVMKLFSRKRAESWDSIRDEVDGMISFVAKNISGSEVNVGELVFGLTRNIIYRAAFGASCSLGQDEFIRIMQEFSKLFGEFNIADFVPWLSWVDPHGLTDRLVKARASLDGFIDNIIDDHLEKKKCLKNVLVGDMVDELLAFYSEDETQVTEYDDLQNAMKLTRDNIKAIIMDVMFGGTETVASAIEWTMAELMRSPEDLKKVQAELDKVVGLDKKIEESDFDKLPYLKCCLKETLRLHPPIPLLLHETAEATEVSGYYIPAKSRIVINAWAIGHDTNSWEDPDSFKPFRFLKESVLDFKGNHFEFIPFGSGRRSCPEMQLGLYALEVAHLLHCFTWKLPSGMKPSELDMSDVFGLTSPRATRLVSVPTPRLICPLH
ncbi:oxygenase [Lithospermum erythrorhizon]|uniref:Oxygenase n=1 Tax=Lithospermum erythrorhizon TaxID=34254 RepID=A0AAV3NXT2_LITER